jgi:hypothetical protein
MVESLEKQVESLRAERNELQERLEMQGVFYQGALGIG